AGAKNFSASSSRSRMERRGDFGIGDGSRHGGIAGTIPAQFRHASTAHLECVQRPSVAMAGRARSCIVCTIPALQTTGGEGRMGRMLTTSCCIAGGGPAGLMAGLLLARAGVDVVVLEKHADFLRDFRGDTIHPSTLQVMHELGYLNELLALPHQPVR